MKRILCLVLTLIMALSVAATAMAEGVSFTPELCSALDMGVSEWYASEQTRALLTVLLLLDAQNAQSETGMRFDSDDIDWTHTYLGKIDATLFACVGLENNQFLLIGFAPAIDTALIEIKEATNLELVIEGAMEATCESYYQNSTDTLLVVMETLQEIVNN